MVVRPVRHRAGRRHAREADGNGYPLAAVIARQELFDRLKASTEVFSTFGGNPVAARAALAVLDVIEDERLIENAARVGEELWSALEGQRAPNARIVAVRGRGLLVGVELETSELAELLVNRMRDDGVLISCGRASALRYAASASAQPLRSGEPGKALVEVKVAPFACRKFRLGQLPSRLARAHNALPCDVISCYRWDDDCPTSVRSRLCAGDAAERTP